MPLAFAYLAECCPRLSRGRWTGILVAAGALGGVYAALLAWAVVPTTGEMVVLENKEHFSAWHRFLLLCCLPALCSTLGLVFLPESPRYLVEAGRDVEAMMVYQVRATQHASFILSIFIIYTYICTSYNIFNLMSLRGYIKKITHGKVQQVLSISSLNWNSQLKDLAAWHRPLLAIILVFWLI